MTDVTLPKNKKAMVLLVGPPASGKSTWGKEFAQKVGATYVSTDAIRKAMTGDEGDQTYNPFGIAITKVQRALSMGRYVVVDATNINRAFRKVFIKIADEHEAYKIAVCFEVPREELLKRDAQRERHVGVEVIDDFLQKYKKPESDEVDKVIIKH